MGILDRFRSQPQPIQEKHVYGVHIPEYDDIPMGKPSSKVSAPFGQGYVGSYEYPDFTFEKALEYYKTIGKVQNSVDSTVAKVISRGWYYCPADEKEKLDAQVDEMGEWEEKANLSYILECMIRNWMLTGNDWLGISDWRPIQISSVIAIQRTDDDVITAIRQSINGQQIDLDPEKFIHTKFIDADRSAFGLSAFHSIFNSNFVDADIKSVKSTAAIMRAWDQEAWKIYHKYGSPRTIWAFEGVGKDAINTEIAPLLKQMKAGDRLALDKKPELITESVDPKSRFTEDRDAIDGNMQAGLGSSANRVITEPSAMADAREAGEQDDDRTLGIMEKVRRVMNKEIIPRILGEEWAGKIEFRWGKQDDFDFDPNQYLAYVTAGIISREEFRAMLKETGAKLDDSAYQRSLLQSQIKDQIVQDNQDKGKEIEFLKEKLGKPDIVQDAVLAAIQEVLEDDN